MSKNSAQINAQFFGLAALSPDNGSEKLQRGRLMPQALFRPWQQGLALPRPFIGDHRDREDGVKLAALKEYAGFSQLPQLFGDEWADVNGRYLYSPRRAFWALCEEPISV